MTIVLTWVYIGWNPWRGIFRRHTFFSWAYGFPWRLGSLLLCMWGKTNSKLHETTMVKYQIQAFSSYAWCLCAGGGMVLWSKRTSLCECCCGGKNSLDFTVSKPDKCLSASLSWKWGNPKLNMRKGSPGKMHAAPATRCPVKMKATILLSGAVSSAQVCFIKPLNLSDLLDRVHCSLIFSPVTPGLLQHRQVVSLYGHLFCSGFRYVYVCNDIYIFQGRQKQKRKTFKKSSLWL